MNKAGKKRVIRLVSASCLALAAVTGTAFAGGNSVHIKVPYAKVTKNKKHQHPYTVTVTGSASGNKQLYLFIDSRKCGKNPHTEYSRTGTYGTAYGYYWASVSGGFTHSAQFETKARITDHACAYLTSSTAPKNGKTGVVARSSKSYKVH